MIATPKRPRPRSVPAWHAQFLAMAPAITKRANFSFRGLGPEARQDLVQEVLANCLVAFRRLVKLDKANLAYPSVLARYAIAQVRRGRRVAGGSNRQDVLSRYVQYQHGIVVERLNELDGHPGSWRAILIEDRRATPADVAACRIDFEDWLSQLSRAQRRLVKLLARGGRACEIARRLRVSDGRISQLRSKLYASWNVFQRQALAEPV